VSLKLYHFFEVLNVVADYDVDSFGDFVMTLVEYDLQIMR